MYMESVPNRNSPPAILLRESFCNAGRVRKRTVANLSKWPPTLVEGLRVMLKGGTAVSRLDDAFDIVRSKPHGHVAAVLGTLRKLRLDRAIAGAGSPERPPPNTDRLQASLPTNSAARRHAPLASLRIGEPPDPGRGGRKAHLFKVIYCPPKGVRSSAFAWLLLA